MQLSGGRWPPHQPVGASAGVRDGRLGDGREGGVLHPNTDSKASSGSAEMSAQPEPGEFKGKGHVSLRLW